MSVTNFNPNNWNFRESIFCIGEYVSGSDLLERIGDLLSSHPSSLFDLGNFSNRNTCMNQEQRREISDVVSQHNSNLSYSVAS